MDTNKLATIEEGMLESVSGGTFGCGINLLGAVLGAVENVVCAGVSLIGGLLGGLCGGGNKRGCR